MCVRVTYLKLDGFNKLVKTYSTENFLHHLHIDDRYQQVYESKPIIISYYKSD